MDITKQLTYGLNLRKHLESNLMSLKKENLKPLRNILNINKYKNSECDEIRGEKKKNIKKSESIKFPKFCSDPNLVSSYMKENEINIEYVNFSGKIDPIRFFEDIVEIKQIGIGFRSSGEEGTIVSEDNNGQRSQNKSEGGNEKNSLEETRHNAPTLELVQGKTTKQQKQHIENTTLQRTDYDKLFHTIKETFGFKKPTKIQKICIPTIISGCNTICISQTGSGKTCAFLIPLLIILKLGSLKTEWKEVTVSLGIKKEGSVDVLTQGVESKFTGVENKFTEVENKSTGVENKSTGVENNSCFFIRSLIVVPTNELARQIYDQSLILFEGFPEFRVLHLTREDEVKEHIDVSVCTPLILLHLIEKKRVSLSKCIFIVFDEVDKLFEVNFLSHVNNLLQEIQNKKMQKIFTTATMPGCTRSFISTLCTNYAVVYFGQNINMINRNVKQELVYVNNEEEKTMVLRNLIRSGGIHIPVLIFVDGIAKAKMVYTNLCRSGIGRGGDGGEREKILHIAMLTSEKTKEERKKIFQELREGRIWYLVCTDIMSRGIDIHGIETVINYDVCYDKYNYIHRVGRACRSDKGEFGKAITLFTHQNVKYMKDIVKFVKSSGTRVPSYLENFPFKRGRKFGFYAAKKKGSRGGGRRA
ncbi:ATP-dependent RNA helicase [Plasmodium gonderi]|uniref:RNA helicase n=1 Tax=Plasmodium gonderi TaxID=77519 RepID=A0A1Y1JFD0_PLAGO|nr:ATP-dependent RNA helicase [Plasmodium gonderi]GAW79917.1 ATP-dependent RNA helicase [Plasmodium gonderi]